MNSPRWNAHKAAMASDGFVVSDYARNSPDEDIAETLVLYMAVRGKPEEAEVSALMPARFRLIDELLSRPPPSPAVARSGMTVTNTFNARLAAGYYRG